MSEEHLGPAHCDTCKRILCMDEISQFGGDVCRECAEQPSDKGGVNAAGSWSSGKQSSGERFYKTNCDSNDGSVWIGDHQGAITSLRVYGHKQADALLSLLNARAPKQDGGELPKPDSGLVEIDIFVHSHADTGKPLAVEIASIKGAIEIEWLMRVFYDGPEHEQSELADYFHRKGVQLDGWTTCVVMPVIENASGLAEYYAEFVRLGTLTAQTDNTQSNFPHFCYYCKGMGRVPDPRPQYSSGDLPCPVCSESDVSEKFKEIFGEIPTPQPDNTEQVDKLTQKNALAVLAQIGANTNFDITPIQRCLSALQQGVTDE